LHKVLGNNVELQNKFISKSHSFLKIKWLSLKLPTCESPNTFTFFLHTIKQLSSGVKNSGNKVFSGLSGSTPGPRSTLDIVVWIQVLMP